MSGDGLVVLAVDDERPALEDLARVLRMSPRVAELRTATSARDALLLAGEQRFDAIFLDVRMPGLDGIELARVLGRFAQPPAIVFVSAYETAAVDAFTLHALDYVMKPVGRARIDEALARVPARGTAPPGADAAAIDEAAGDLVAVDDPRTGTTRLLPRPSILYVEAHGDYVRLVTDDGRFLLRTTLNDLEQRWMAHGFVRVHRGFMANLHHVSEIRPQLGGSVELRFGEQHAIPVARRHVADLRRRLRV